MSWKERYPWYLPHQKWLVYQGVIDDPGGLEGVTAAQADLQDADFTGANLFGAILIRANLIGAILIRANLRGANLSGANLSGANLRDALLMDAIGNMAEVKSLFLDTYSITYTADVLQIGCERHSIDEWRTFDDDQILKMDGEKGLRWWNKYKTFILQAIELSPATPTGRSS